MKILLSIILLLLLFSTAYAQNEDFDMLMSKAKYQFNDTLQKPDYALAIKELNMAIELKPDNAEAHYFLGYAYSRFNSFGGESIPDMKMPLVLKASAELEKVISITPLYKGQIVTIDPYSKITSEWGALALSYLVNNKIDSAKWAFKEGKKRGGFDDFILAINSAVLNACNKNAILACYGDDYTFPLYYLQTVEKLRTDVSFFDKGLLNTHWYASFLERTSTIKFGISHPALDTLDYEGWIDSTISIPIDKTSTFFTWLVKPYKDGNYLLREDRLFMNLLKVNKFRRDVYFTEGFPNDGKLSLSDYLTEYDVSEKLNTNKEQPESIDQFINRLRKTSATFRYTNPNSQNEQNPIDNIREQIIDKIKLSDEKDRSGIKARLFKTMKDLLPEKDFPIFDQSIRTELDDMGF
jgi:hypothetical protein